jgi:hypothetical protein
MILAEYIKSTSTDVASSIIALFKKLHMSRLVRPSVAPPFEDIGGASAGLK